MGRCEISVVGLVRACENLAHHGLERGSRRAGTENGRDLAHKVT